MIYEVRTDTFRPGALPAVIQRFGEAYEHRKKVSELAGCWSTEIGPLNQLIHIWPYHDAAARATVKNAATKLRDWPPDLEEFLVHSEAESFLPFPFDSWLKPGKYGPFYELRSYIVKPGAMPDTIKIWQETYKARAEVSPLAAVMYSELGRLYKFIHIWPYETLVARLELREKSVEIGVWPPPGGPAMLVSQENKILLPAPFSPMK